MKRFPARGLTLVLRLYRRLISPAFPRRCKFEPSCSAYAEQAIQELGAVRGTLLSLWRLLRCNPFGHGGYDPLEARRLFRGRDAATERASCDAPSHGAHA